MGSRAKKGCDLINTNFQDVGGLRNRGWDSLPPPPVLATRKPKPTDQKDSAATPIVASLGLPNGDPEPQIPQPQSSPVDPLTTPETDPVSAIPDTHSPSISIAALSDFTPADTSDVESPTDLTVITPHDMFYLEDGNVEVLCRNTLFCVHTSIPSFHSPALHQMFTQTNLATADSPNGCPWTLSSAPAKDFATLLKVIYLLGFDSSSCPTDRWSTDSLRTRCRIFLLFRPSELWQSTSYPLSGLSYSLISDAYPETFEVPFPSKPDEESVFSGLTPHPNKALNLLLQQNLMSTLPARRGLGHPASV